MDLQHRIGVDARPLAFAGNGNARYLYRMLKELLNLYPGFEFIFLTHRPPHPEHQDLLLHPSVVLNVDHGPFSRPGLSWINLRLPALLKEYHCNLFWGTLAMLPVFGKIDIPMVVNFHDLNSFAAPRTMSLANRIQHRLFDGKVLEKADQIYCLSKTTKEDIQHYFPSIPEETLHIIYPGAERFPAKPEELPPKLNHLKEFILSIGTVEPRKNYGVLITAYKNARKKTTIPPLLIIGRKGWGDESTYQLLSSGELETEDIYFFEGATDGQLETAYERSSFLAFPSLHEGFGLPVIEAYQYGKSAILSNIRVFREVGSHARFADPNSPKEWEDAIIEYCEKLRRNNLPRPDFNNEEWSWKNRAQRLGELMQKAVK